MTEDSHISDRDNAREAETTRQLAWDTRCGYFTMSPAQPSKFSRLWPNRRLTRGWHCSEVPRKWSAIVRPAPYRAGAQEPAGGPRRSAWGCEI